MADFIYQEPFPIQEDKTEYRLLTKDYVKVVECDGRKILKVDPKGLELLAKEAYADVSFYLRASHLQKLANILEDPEATDNDKFVAYTMLMNQCVAAEGELPTCQDTGTAICIGHKGEDVYTGANDAECISRGVYETYKERNLRYSQVVPFTMTEEKNSATNLPAQIDIYAGHPGMEYEFLFITKGGGSANKTFLYQQTKALLNEESLTAFIKKHILNPLVDLADLLAVEAPVVAENAVHGGREGLVGLVHRHHAAHEAGLLDADVTVRRRMIGDAAHQALALPVAVGGQHRVGLHAQLPRHLLQGHRCLRVIALHQAVEVHAHRVARGGGQVFQDELIVHRGHVEQGILLVKAEHGHGARLLCQ